MQEKMERISARELHKIVWAMVGVFGLFSLSYPLAMWRVSQHEKFAGFHVKSFPLEIKKVSVEGKEKESFVKTSPPKALDPDSLLTMLYVQINRSWRNSPTFNQNLVYRVQIRRDNGTIASFEPLNEGAQNYVSETPLPELVNRQSQESRKVLSTNLSEFTVVFTPEGVLEVGAY
jgi:hypothetical protein